MARAYGCSKDGVEIVLRMSLVEASTIVSVIGRTRYQSLLPGREDSDHLSDVHAALIGQAGSIPAASEGLGSWDGYGDQERSIHSRDWANRGGIPRVR